MSFRCLTSFFLETEFGIISWWMCELFWNTWTVKSRKKPSTIHPNRIAACFKNTRWLGCLFGLSEGKENSRPSGGRRSCRCSDIDMYIHITYTILISSIHGVKDHEIQIVNVHKCSKCISLHAYIYIYTCIYTYIYIYIHGKYNIYARVLLHTEGYVFPLPSTGAVGRKLTRWRTSTVLLASFVAWVLSKKTVVAGPIDSPPPPIFFVVGMLRWRYWSLRVWHFFLIPDDVYTWMFANKKSLQRDVFCFFFLEGTLACIGWAEMFSNQ